MKCSKIQEWISLEIDDQLPPENVRPLQDHLQACEDCRKARQSHCGFTVTNTHPDAQAAITPWAWKRVGTSKPSSARYL